MRRSKVVVRKGRPAIIGIDIGSTSSRAAVLCPETNQLHYIRNPATSYLTGAFREGDFSSIGYPFDSTDPVYLGSRASPRRKSISLKYGFYPLANATDETLIQYPMITEILTLKDDQKFLSRLKKGLQELLQTIMKEILKFTTKHNLWIEKIGLSIPAQWDWTFQDVYEEIVIAVFGLDTHDIAFHTETIALGHYLLKYNSVDLGLRVDARDPPCSVLFLDFGGHNVNGCIFQVNSCDEKNTQFSLIHEAFGVGGGSELWNHLVLELCKVKFADESKYINDELPPESLLELRSQFNSQKNSLGPHSEADVDRIHMVCGMAVGVWSVSLSQEEVNKCFYAAMEKPFALAKDKMQLLTSITENCPMKVVVSGGTSKNDSVKKIIRDICSECSLPEPVFTDGIDILYDATKIAQGVALAAGTDLDFKSFLAQGAIFCLQRLQRTPRNKNAEESWDNMAVPLLPKKEPGPFVLTSTGAWGGEELKIICAPFGRRLAPEKNGMIRCSDCYDVIYVGKLKKGKWSFSLSLHYWDGEPYLHFDQSRIDPTPQEMPPVIIPLYPDRGTRSFLAFYPEVDVEGLIRLGDIIKAHERGVEPFPGMKPDPRHLTEPSTSSRGEKDRFDPRTPPMRTIHRRGVKFPVLPG